MRRLLTRHRVVQLSVGCAQFQHHSDKRGAVESPMAEAFRALCNHELVGHVRVVRRLLPPALPVACRAWRPTGVRHPRRGVLRDWLADSQGHVTYIKTLLRSAIETMRKAKNSGFAEIAAFCVEGRLSAARDVAVSWIAEMEAQASALEDDHG